MEWNQPPEKGMLIDTINQERLEFPLNPEQITDSKTTSYAAIKVPGLNRPRYQFVTGDVRKIEFKIHLFQGPVMDQVAWLRSRQVPERENARLVAAPHSVLFLFGTMYSGVLCVITSVKADFHSLFSPELEPMQCEVSLALEVLEDQKR